MPDGYVLELVVRVSDAETAQYLIEQVRKLAAHEMGETVDAAGVFPSAIYDADETAVPALREWRQSESHRTYTGPSGIVVVPAHTGDLARGTLRSILRMAAMAGLAALVLAIAIGVFA